MRMRRRSCHLTTPISGYELATENAYTASLQGCAVDIYIMHRTAHVHGWGMQTL
jgi:hypothetical protein